MFKQNKKVRKAAPAKHSKKAPATKKTSSVKRVYYFGPGKTADCCKRFRHLTLARSLDDRSQSARRIIGFSEVQHPHAASMSMLLPFC